MSLSATQNLPPTRNVGAIPPRSRANDSEIANLLARISAGDAKAFSHLYRLTSPRLYRVALRVLRTPACAEEALQEAFVNIWRHASSYQAERNAPLPWLTSIVRHRALDHLRRRQKTADTRALPDGRWAAEVATPCSPLLEMRARYRLFDALDGLESHLQQCLVLTFCYGLSHAELAAHLRQPVGTVKSWIRRSLLRLRRSLESI